MSNLKGRVAVVTGGSRDIGRAIAIKLAHLGAKVVVNYFNSEEGAKTVKEILETGGEAVAIKADVSQLDQIEDLKNQTIAAFGKQVDILVNNAGGLFARRTLEQFDEAFFDLVIGVNFNHLFVSQAFESLMGRRCNVNISSQAARDGGGGGSTLYASSKEQ